MRVLVCGGRDFRDKQWLYRVLDDLHETAPISCIIEGEQRGADIMSRWWATERKVPVAKFPADWNRYGGDAGPIRNLQMLEEGKPDLVVAFPGGSGTANMVDQANRAGIAVTKLKED